MEVDEREIVRKEGEGKGGGEEIQWNYRLVMVTKDRYEADRNRLEHKDEIEQERVVVEEMLVDNEKGEKVELGEGDQINAGKMETRTQEKGQKKEQENAGAGKKGRGIRLTPRSMRNPPQEINTPMDEVKLGEKRKFMLRDEPDDMLVDMEVTEKKGNKMAKIGQETYMNERVTEAIPEGPPQCQ